MKAKSFLLTTVISALFVVFFTFPLTAGKPVVSTADKVQKIIRESIKYPDRARKACCQGKVDVIFTVTDEGRISIIKTFSNNEDIEELVRKQLSDICCKGFKPNIKEQYKVTISFKLIG